MGQVLEASLSLATELLKFLNTEASKRYLDQLTGLEKDIVAEKAKGYLRDDGRLETLYQNLPILIQAAQAELMIYAKSTQTPASPVAH